MWIVVTLAASLVIAHALSWQVTDGKWQRAAFDALVGSILWLGSTWVLALSHLLTPPFVVGRTIVFVIAAVILAPRKVRVDVGTIVILTPLVVWTIFILWRGALLPPVSHDALSYHLPKAILYARAHGFDPLTVMDIRVRTIPSNYEMLLADVIVMSGSDALTEWVSTWFFIAFVIVGVALAERWFGYERRSLLAITFLTAGVPVLLLHSGAHKNDVMTAFFIVSAFLWFGAWFSEPRPTTMVLVIVALAGGIGTKPQALAAAAALAPFVVWRERRLRVLAGYAAVSIAAFLLLGGMVYVRNQLSARAPLPVGSAHGTPDTGIVYGDWSNLWQGPYVLLAAPFAPGDDDLPVPWESRPWFWPRYEIFFSHLGIPFALCALLVPAAIATARRHDPARQRERAVVSIAALFVFVALLPVVFLPHGLFDISLPRYALFIVPIVFAWTVPQFLARFSGVVNAVLLVSAGWFVFYAIDNGINDRFAPLKFVMWQRHHPRSRMVPFDRMRAGEAIDAVAGPHDSVAMEAAYSAWIYPIFGADLTRPVELIPPGGPPRVSNDVKYVGIDHTFDIAWTDPRFQDLSQYHDFLGKGYPSGRYESVFRDMLRDSRFRMMWYYPSLGQAVFKRVR